MDQFPKYVKATIVIEGQEIKVPIHISCTSVIPDKELIRRAGNIFREAVNNATYFVTRNAPCGSCAFDCDKEECEERKKDDFSI